MVRHRDLTPLQGAMARRSTVLNYPWLWKEISNCQTHLGNWDIALRLKNKLSETILEFTRSCCQTNEQAVMNWLTHSVMGVGQLASAPIRSGTGRASVHTGHVLPQSKQASCLLLSKTVIKLRSPLEHQRLCIVLNSRCMPALPWFKIPISLCILLPKSRKKWVAIM